LPRGFGEGGQVQAGVDDAGTAIVLWSAGGIRSARNTAADAWSASRTISTSPTAHDPDLSVSGSGDAIAAWAAQDGIRVTEFTPASGWSAHHLVGPGGVRPSIAANDEAQVVLAWALPRPPDPTPGSFPTQSVHAATGDIRGGLDDAVPLSDPIPEDIFLHHPTPEAAIGSRGDVVVAWNRALFPRVDSTVEVATRQLPFPWSYPSSISVPALVPRPALAVLADGTAIATWRGGSAAVRPADQADWLPSRWDPPFVLSAPTADVYNPQVAADDAGRLHVVWADVSRPQTRYEDHLAFMAVQATSFGLPGPRLSPPVPTSPGTTAGGKDPGDAKASTAIPRLRFSVASSRGGLVLIVRATLPRSVAGRTLLIQRRAGGRTLNLAALKIAPSGRINRGIALAAGRTSGAKGVKGTSVMVLRGVITASTTATAASSRFARVAIPRRRGR
jgi:hypothetical protein